MLVERNIRNVGVSSASASYGYFLNLNGSPNVLEVNQGGIPIPVVLPTGELTFAPTVALDYPGNGQSEDRGADLLVIPSTLAPPAGAQYTLALVLDPQNQVIEQSPAPGKKLPSVNRPLRVVPWLDEASPTSVWTFAAPPRNRR